MAAPRRSVPAQPAATTPASASGTATRPRRGRSAWRAGALNRLLRSAFLLQDLPHLLGRDGDVHVPDAEVRERVDDRVGDGRRCSDGGRLADALGAERVV